MINDYPVNYQKTLAQAKKQSEIQRAMEYINEIEDRWARVSACEGYSFRDLKKNVLLTDITILLRCCITLLNKVIEQEALIKHQKPQTLMRIAKRISLPMGGI